jgi:predicted patatin/cPLA2 family phospholipase
MRDKIAIIFLGAGLASSYSVGSILGLIDKYKLTNPEIVLAGSGSVGTASYFVSGQYESLKNIWINLLSTRKFINFWRFWKILNIDYLIDEVFKKQSPLNQLRIRESKIKYYISVTNNYNSKVEFLSAKNNIFEKMRASKSMPFFYGRRVKIGNKKYVDTFLSSSGINLKLKKAVELGANKIIVLNPNLKSKFAHFLIGIWSFFKGKDFYKNYFKQSKYRYAFPESVKIFEICPKKHLKIFILDNSKKFINSLIDLGYSEVINNKELERFMEKLK